MKQSRYVTPRLGILSVLSAVLGMIAIRALWDNDFSLQFPLDLGTTAHLTAIGGLYGIVGGTCWMLTVVRNVVLRWILRLGIVVVGTVVELSLSGADGWVTELVLRWSTSLGGLMISQTVIFILLGIPGWQWRDATEPRSKRPRFSIGAVLVLTLCVAMLLALAVRYQTSVNSVLYWTGLAGIWVLIPLTSAGVVASMLDRTPSQRLAGAVATVAATLSLAAVGSFAIGIAEQRADARVDGDWQLWACCYGMMIASSMATMAILSLAGRLDRAALETGLVQQDS